MREQKAILIVITLLISLTGGFIFYILHLPLPWMLGPITMILLWKAFAKKPLFWPFELRQMGLAIIGFFLGSTFTRDIFASILSNLPYMFLSTIFLIIFSLGIAYVLAHSLAISFPTAVIGNMPGGFSQMVLLGEELKSVDSTAVTLMQTLRIIIVVFSVPFLIRYAIVDGSLLEESLVQHLSSSVETTFYISSYFIYVPVIMICIWLACKLKLPTSYLIGALLGTALLVVFEVPLPIIPSQIFIVAQLCIAASLGLSIQVERLSSLKKLGLYTIMSSILLVFFAGLMAYGLSIWLSIPLATSFLSLAPGGIPEMGIIGQEIKADISLITSYQLFRLFFILFVVPVVIKWWFVKEEPTNKLSVTRNVNLTQHSENN